MVDMANTNSAYPGDDIVADVLDDARERLMSAGWTQGIWRNRAGHYCTAGAISTVSMERICETYSPGSVIFAIDAVLEHLGLGKPEHLPHWNDAPERTFDEVVDALEMTAKKVRAGDITPR